VEADTPPTRAADGYSGAAVAGAALTTIFFPLFSLIAALLMLGGQADPAKRKQLRTWAWVAGGFIVLQILFVVTFVGVGMGSGSGS
jgi:hypothetical protein